MDRRRIGFVLLFIACVGIPGWVWYTRSKDEPPATPPNAGLAFGDWVKELDLVNDLGHPAARPFPRGKNGTVLMFWHVQCPAVAATHPRFESLMTKYEKRGFDFIAIDSEPLDELDDVKARRLEMNVKYEVWRDNRRATATKLGVTRAATFLVFDREARLVYRGAFDDGLKPPKVGYVHQALSAILADTKTPVLETQSPGCPYTEPK